VIQQRLLDAGLQDKGIIVAEGYDLEIIDIAYAKYDNLCLAVTLKNDGSVDKTVVASVVESVKVVDSGKIDDEGFSRLKEILTAKSLQLLSLTITEKGYALTGGGGLLLPDVETDFTAGPSAPKNLIGKITALCYHRFISGAAPLALVSMDNCSHNGTRLYEAVRRYAVEWVKRGFIEAGFLSYIDDPGRLSFPWSMIDKITPGPDKGIKRILNEAGLEGADITVTGKNTYIAPFVNSEEAEYLVIEDAFPNGRPPFEKAGVLMADRETVNRVEKMKVRACLNPLHTALAVFGCLFSYERISDEMKDGDLVKLIRRVADEALPAVVDPVVISPAEFIDEVINTRLPNPFIPDTPQRIATDTSQKISVRFGETIKAYIEDKSLDISTLSAIPLVLAGWIRYLLGIDDNGNVFKPSPDPMLSELQAQLADVTMGDYHTADYHKTLSPLLSNAAVFGLNLYETCLAAKIEEYFAQMLSGVGAVRKILTEAQQ
jgi:fructuronate reductase